MQNDYHDDFEGQESSEYHFSDEDINYEEGTAKTVEPTPVAAPKETIVNRLMNSKRLLISGGVFIVLVFVVYKMVTPTATAPATQIETVANTPTAPVVTEPQGVVPIKSPNITVQAEAPPVSQPMSNQPIPTQPVMTQPVATQQVMTQPVATQQVMTQPVVTQSTMIQPPVTQPPITTTQPAMQPTSTVVTVPVTTQASMQPYQQISPPAMVTGQQPAMNNPIVTQTPNLIISNTGTDEKLAQLKATNERLIGQLEGQYTQQYNDFSNQTRVIQEQMQTLNARVSTLESQLNQLIQALTKKNATTNSNEQPAAMNTTSAAPTASQGPDIKVAYNVQAIIPGRAWLKSDSGETVTVAEGDSIKGVGKVTKIDPYDGVVVLNTGTRSISLSYGENA